jgi:hypothetical protein
MLAAMAMLAWGLLAPSGAVAAGWLIGCLFWLGIAVGAVVLLAVHALTGGRWGAALWPALAPAAASLPGFGLLGLPLALALPLAFPWATDPSAAAPGVARYYLNIPGWSLRAGLAILGWSLLALLLLRGARGAPRRHRLTAAIGLAFHAAIVTLVAMDWVLSVDPRFTSSAFGADFAVMQLMAALAWAAALRVAPAGGAGRAGDLGGLLLAMTLGALYLGFAQYLVIWYGNLPDKAAWYLHRQEMGWRGLDLAAILLTGILPFAVLIREDWRNNPRVLAGIGMAVLLGLLLHWAWLLGPAFGPLALLAAALAWIAIGGIWVALAYGPIAARLEPAHGH